MRAKKIALNSITRFIHQVVIVAAGLILPRLTLSYFGSEYNAVVASITQLLGYISLLAAGVGGVTVAALYQPLAEGDAARTSSIIRATEGFMRKVAIIFIGFLIAMAALYPMLVSNDFNWFFVFSLALILGSGTFIQYYFGITYKLLLSADQRSYLYTLVQICAVILNTGISVYLILTGYEIRIVYLISAIVFAINPVFIYYYIRRRYNIDHSASPDNSAIKQRWDAFAHQIAGFVNANTPIVVLTVFAGIWEVAVYVIYFMIIKAIRVLIIELSGSGMDAAFGNMLAKSEHKALQKGLRIYEFTTHSLSTLLLACTAVLIVPFVSVYTLGIDDVDYYRPLFALLACIAEFFFAARSPYQAIINAAGHFRQTRNAAFVEIGINITISVILVQWLGLVGAIIGILCSLVFRTVVFAVYVSRNIVVRSMWVFARRMLVSLLTAGMILAVAQLLPEMAEITYISWILYALPVFGIAVGVTALSTLLFYREEAWILWEKVRSLIRG